MSSMVRHVGKTFSNQVMSIDSSEFENCRFLNCRLVYSGGYVVFKNNIFDGGVKWIFDGAAANTVQFMAAMYSAGGGGKQLIEEIIRTIMQRDFWNKRTLEIPAVCETCYTVFGSGARFNNAQDVTFIDNVTGPCPRCEGTGRMLDGSLGQTGPPHLVNHRFVSEALAVLTDTEVSYTDIEKLYAVIERIKEQRTPLNEITSVIKSETPSLSAFAHILAPKLSGDLYQLLAVLLYIRGVDGQKEPEFSSETFNNLLLDQLERAAR